MAKKPKPVPETAAPPEDQAPAPAGGPPGLRILAQYVRDISFENPRAPNSLTGDMASLKVERHIEINARGREDGLFEVDLKLVASATREGETVFLADVVYGGLFALDNVPMADIQAILAVECPRFLFPFARQIVANVTADGGFPPVRSDPIDFGGIFMQRQAELAAAQNGGAPQN